MRTSPTVLRLVLLSLLAAGCGGGGGGSSAPSIDFTSAPWIPLAIGTAPVEGPADAWVTAVEFLDYACPYCAEEAPVVAQLRTLYPDDLRVAVKHFPVHTIGWPAARAAVCAQGQGLFWEMHESLFAHRPDFSDEELAAYAAAIPGMDMEAWNACFASDAAQARVEADRAEGLQDAVGVRGTPTFVLNGKRVEGAYELPAMRALVEQALAAARASGYSRSEYYDKVVLGE
jgi:protein-disulfide isomerase